MLPWLLEGSFSGCLLSFAPTAISHLLLFFSQSTCFYGKLQHVSCPKFLFLFCLDFFIMLIIYILLVLFFNLIFILYWVNLIYSVVLVSSVELVIQLFIYRFFSRIGPFRVLSRVPCANYLFISPLAYSVFSPS